MEGEKMQNEKKGPRKSRITKKISRTFFNKSIKIPKYENVMVEVSFDEEVEWNDLKERKRKSDNITKLLKEDFNQTTKTLFAKLMYAKNEDAVQSELAGNIQNGLDEHGLGNE